ncbi:MAG: T9SS type A sorting domain-containing protein [Bacteroidetes bacterium]|nr:T9SS type A sorting domain-containing protein [Bacteroidota bacterium]
MKKMFFLSAVFFICTSSFSQNNIHVHDTICFENPYEYIKIDTSSQNLWQIGIPKKSFFDSAFSLPNAIVTDTINFYSINNYSYFDLLIGEFNYQDYYWISFGVEIKHKFDTDTLNDGCYFTISFDNGKTWDNVINNNYSCLNPDITGINLYNLNDTLFNGEKGFSGKSDAWLTTSFYWSAQVTKNHEHKLNEDSVILRFNFISDSIQNNKEGWMIDNIKLISNTDLGDIKTVQNFGNINIYPNPFSSNTKLYFNKYYRTVELNIYNIQGQLVGSQKYLNKKTIKINKNNLKTGVYFFKIILDDIIIETRKVIAK